MMSKEIMHPLRCQINSSVETHEDSPRSLKRELLRKSLHLPVFIFPFIATYSTVIAMLMLTTLIIGYLALIVYEKRYGKTIPIISKIVSHCKRNVDYDFGPVYLALGFILALYIAPPKNVFYAAFVISVCDSAASLMGMRFGKNNLLFLNKSFVGSASFFVTCFLVGIFFVAPLKSIPIALCLTMVELFSIKDLDNFTLPIASQILLSIAYFY